MKTLTPITRIILAIAVLSMVSGYFLPLWEIQLWAPQYPEGLNMKIWLTHLSGDFDIINGLNHYIGMRHIKQEMFPEFGYMGSVLGFLIASGLVPVIGGKRPLLTAFVVILFIGAGLGLYDFWRWGYDYGHHLDPKAAISVPGMTYDPPLIGYKNLLNFVAYSGPDTGGWVLVLSGVVSTALLLWESFFAGRKKIRKPAGLVVIPLLAMLLLLPGCKQEAVAIDYGKDECAGCKMLIVDKHYGCELVTAKGKVFKFDDLNCMSGFLSENSAAASGGMQLVIDFEHPGSFIAVENAVYLKHSKLRTPMGSGLGAFTSETAANAVANGLGDGGSIVRWPAVSKETSEKCSCCE